MLVTFVPEEAGLKKASFGVITTTGKIIRFDAGLNDNISKADWEAIKDIPEVQRLEDRKALIVHKNENADEIEQSDEPLEHYLSLKTPEVFEVINSCHNMERLKELQKLESRTSVLAAITRRINALAKGRF